ncbi:MAG TPA: nucleotidyltransferase family protein [Armatimonadota bacterium]|nr:nucleotidyltransferase family protein [Armatimonadota bacterium]
MLTPEQDLILRCARSHLNPGERDTVHKALCADPDWHAVLQMAAWHGTLPLLYDYLYEIAPEDTPLDRPVSPPAEVMNQLGIDSRVTVQENLYQTGQLIRLLRRFEECGIRILPFKGPTLALLAFGGLSRRPFCDLDLLVEPSRVFEARDLLFEMGYRYEMPLSASEEAAYRRYHYHLRFVSENPASLIELHWRATPAYFGPSPRFTELWDRRQLVPMGGVLSPTFGDEDLALYLCAHGARHWWNRVGYISSLSALIESGSILDWPLLLHRATDMGLRRVLLLGLMLARDLLGAALPSLINEAIRSDGALPQLETRVRGWLFMGEPTPTGLLTGPRFHLAVRDRFIDRLAYLFRSVVTPTAADWSFVSLPPTLVDLYFIVRPARLLNDAVRWLIDAWN